MSAGWRSPLRNQSYGLGLETPSPIAKRAELVALQSGAGVDVLSSGAYFADP